MNQSMNIQGHLSYHCHGVLEAGCCKALTALALKLAEAWQQNGGGMVSGVSGKSGVSWCSGREEGRYAGQMLAALGKQGSSGGATRMAGHQLRCGEDDRGARGWQVLLTVSSGLLWHFWWQCYSSFPFFDLFF